MAIRASASITLTCVVDVWFTTRYYLLQASTLNKPAKPTTRPPAGGWDDTEPGYVAGSTNTLYFVDLTVFSDGTWAYSMVSASSAYEAAKAAYAKAQAAQNTAEQALSSTEVVVGTQTAATNAWTGRAGFASLADGQTILYWLPFAGTSTAATLNLTLSGGGTTGAKAVYIDAATRCTTHISAGNMVQMVYREGVAIGTGTYTGWWISRTRNDNTYDRIRLNNVVKAKSAITASRVIVGDSSGYFHLAAGSIFDVDKPILWAGSAIAAAATGSNNYLSYPSCTLRNNAGSSWTATQYATLYLAGTLNGSAFTVAASNWLTTAPSNASLTYISLGYMYSTYQMYMYPEHPMYRIVNGGLKAVSQIAYEAQVAAKDAQTAADGAVAQEQLIYISKAAGTASVAAPAAWVTSAADAQNAWTLKRPTYSSGYPVLFVATQRRTVGGAVSCSAPLKDDTTTVIDGGHITTGTIDASRVTVTNLSADEITAGVLNDLDNENYWNLNTGEFVTTRGRIGNFTLANGRLSYATDDGTYTINMSETGINTSFYYKSTGNTSAVNLYGGRVEFYWNGIDIFDITCGDEFIFVRSNKTTTFPVQIYDSDSALGQQIRIGYDVIGTDLELSGDLKVKGDVSLDKALPIKYGGTGATTVADARGNLQIYDGYEYFPGGTAAELDANSNFNTGIPFSTYYIESVYCPGYIATPWASGATGNWHVHITAVNGGLMGGSSVSNVRIRVRRRSYSA